MSRRRRLGAVLGAILVLTSGACTDPEAPAPRPEDPAAGSPVETAPGKVPPADQPVVLVTHATELRAAITVRAAKAALRGTLSRWSVIAAPTMPVGPAVPVLRSATAVVREVERGPGTLGVVPANALGPTVRRVVVDGVDPLHEPERYFLHTDGAAPPRATTLVVVGDVMLSRGVLDPAAALRPMSGLLRQADLTVGNLESTLSDDGEPRQGTDSFAAEPAVIEPLVRAGFDALSLANNHAGDYGPRALLETVGLLGASPIDPFGAGADLAEAGAGVVLERHGIRFGFLGFNAIGETPAAGAGRPGALSVRMPPRTGPLNRTDLAHVLNRVRALEQQADVVVVLPHWGTQYTHRPEPVQRLVGRRLGEAGADLVVGGHPHWVQGLDLLGGMVVAHSLGNFVFDMDFMTETQQGVVMEATYWGSTLKAIDLVPYRMDAGFAPRPASPAEERRILTDVWSASSGPFRMG